ncbi:MAG: hypothetical protein E7271_00290 [Lachnospiraceae bacterium]|nr:hypothetical protein [Lachnospiraceae bacterium]
MVEKTMSEVLSLLQQHRTHLNQIYNESREENVGALSWNQIRHLKRSRKIVDRLIMIAAYIQDNPECFTDEDKQQIIDNESSIKDLMIDINRTYEVGQETREERRIMKFF